MEIGLVVGDPSRGGTSTKSYTYNYGSGQASSFRTGDAQWMLDNYWNTFTFTRGLANKLDPTDFSKVLFTNPFGTKDRLTDLGDNYLVDNLQGLGISNVVQAAVDWNTAIDNSLGTDFGGTNTLNGFTDWFLPTVEQHVDLFDYALAAVLFGAPLGIASNLQTSTTRPDNTLRVNIIQNSGGLVLQQVKTGILQHISMRKHF